jgi:dolichol-phosphate mannosyltransferase
MNIGSLVTVVIPCCNEEAALPLAEKALQRLSDAGQPFWTFRYIFIDDGSTDATWTVLNRLFGDRRDCRLLRHSQNRGLTAACLTGLRAAESEFVAVIDCDCSYDPIQILYLLEELGPNISCVTASPYHPRGRVQDVAWWRLTLSRSASRLYRLILRNGLWTYTSCFRVYRRSHILDLPIMHDGFLGTAEIIALLLARGRTVAEVPAVLRARTVGQSKLRVIKTALGHSRLLARIAFDRIDFSKSWGKEADA